MDGQLLSGLAGPLPRSSRTSQILPQKHQACAGPFWAGAVQQSTFPQHLPRPTGLLAQSDRDMAEHAGLQCTHTWLFCVCRKIGGQRPGLHELCQSHGQAFHMDLLRESSERFTVGRCESACLVVLRPVLCQGSILVCFCNRERYCYAGAHQKIFLNRLAGAIAHAFSSLLRAERALLQQEQGSEWHL